MNPGLEAAFSLDGRVAVVTGAASGIGRQTAETLAQAGATVFLADIDGPGVERAAREIGGGARAMQIDVTSREQVNALAAFVSEQGIIRVWANVAGTVETPADVCDQTEETLDRLIAINLKGCYWGCAAAVRAMDPAAGGSIINVSSGAGELPAPGLSAYCMSKAGVNMLTKTVALEAGPKKIRVNAIAPGRTDTPLIAFRFTEPDGSIDPAKKKAYLAERATETALGVTLQPIDMAYAIHFLACDASRYITGQVIRVDGGQR